MSEKGIDRWEKWRNAVKAAENQLKELSEKAERSLDTERENLKVKGLMSNQNDE